MAAAEGTFYTETPMRAPFRILCAGTLLIGTVAFVGCDKKADTATPSTAAPTTMDSAKQAADTAAGKAADTAKKVGEEVKDAATKAADKTKDAAETAKDKASQALDGLKK
jgi:hypothetical protein